MVNYLLTGATFFGQNPKLVADLKNYARQITSDDRAGADIVEIKLGTVYHGGDIEDMIGTLSVERRAAYDRIAKTNPVEAYNLLVMDMMQNAGIGEAQRTWQAKAETFSQQGSEFNNDPMAIDVRKSKLPKSIEDKLIEEDYFTDKEGAKRTNLVVDLAGVVRDGLSPAKIIFLQSRANATARNFAYALVRGEGLRRANFEDFDAETFRRLQTEGQDVDHSTVSFPLYLKVDDYANLMEKFGVEEIYGVRPAWLDNLGDVVILGQVYAAKTLPPVPQEPREPDMARPRLGFGSKDAKAAWTEFDRLSGVYERDLKAWNERREEAGDFTPDQERRLKLHGGAIMNLIVGGLEKATAYARDEGVIRGIQTNSSFSQRSQLPTIGSNTGSFKVLKEEEPSSERPPRSEGLGEAPETIGDQEEVALRREGGKIIVRTPDGEERARLPTQRLKKQLGEI